MRNPPWTRDELILALDLYFHVNPSHTSADNPKVIELSEILRALPTGATARDPRTFRNPASVYMKLCNFLALDPSYGGAGLRRGSRADREIWEEFSDRRELLEETAKAIKANIGVIPSSGIEGEEEAEALEGRALVRVHLTRERDRSIVKTKKARFLRKNGALYCEVCGFDFAARYGPIGEGYIECHHILPLSSLRPRRPTRLEDLVLVCANCHRMLHRGKPWPTIEQLRASYRRE
jgi:5-methylcytosine-specific restriction protein A